MCKSCCDFTTINIQTTLSNIFNFGFYLRIPFCEVVNSATNFIEWYIAFLPFWHLENFQISKNLSDFLIIFLHIVVGYIVILVNLFIHLPTNTIELDRLWNYWTNISKFLWFFFGHWACFDFSWDSVNTLYHINHIFKCILNIIFEIFLTWIECHVLFFNTHIEQPSLTLLFHLIQE